MANLIEIPTCDICTLEFDDNVIPRFLTACGHSFCQRCIKQMKAGDEVKCPYDTKITIVPSGKPERLPKNFAIAQLSEQIRRGLLPEQKSPSEVKFLDLCHENPQHKATVYCEDCRADLCNQCFQDLHKFNVMRHHMKNQLYSRNRQDTNCPIHRHLELRYACQSNICIAKYPVGCRWCFASGEHKEHCFVKVNELPSEQEKEPIYYMAPTAPQPRKNTNNGKTRCTSMVPLASKEFTPKIPTSRVPPRSRWSTDAPMERAPTPPIRQLSEQRASVDRVVLPQNAPRRRRFPRSFTDLLRTAF
uniref:RING-type domain-containing protein n=1 Tax=Caenorhabditis japonica TaxID=281687 RepID=A0A8R1I9M6_CAEJA